MRKPLWLVLSLTLAAVAGGCSASGIDSDEATGLGREATTAPATAAGPLRGERLVSALRAGGFVIYFRHAATDSAPDDADPVVLSDCGTQRNLSEVGRRKARSIGRSIEALDIPIGRVLSSPFCRALDTARLAFAKATPESTLENLETAEIEAESEARIRALRRLLSAPPDDPTNSVLVAHGFNITAAADISLGEGEAAVFQPKGEAGFTPIATVSPDEWTELAE